MLKLLLKRKLKENAPIKKKKPKDNAPIKKKKREQENIEIDKPLVLWVPPSVALSLRDKACQIQLSQGINF